MTASPQVTVRPAQVEDAPGIAVLAEDLAPASGKRPSLEDLTLLLAHRDHIVFIAADNSTLQGWIHASVVRRVQCPTFVEIGGLVVSPAARRHGIASRLIEAITAWAERQGLPEIRVRVRDTRDNALAFYRQQGFSPSKTQQVLCKKNGPTGADDRQGRSW